jgi:nucleotide-binding universal stress UspA family protein
MAILICYDDSEQSKHAVEVSGALFPGADAHILNVWEPIERIVARYAALAPFAGEELGDADGSAETESARLTAAGVELATAAGMGATPHSAVLSSTIAQAVLAVADRLDVDVIITGTRSLHGVRELVSNTLSHSLIQHSARPVLAIPTPLS